MDMIASKRKEKSSLNGSEELGLDSHFDYKKRIEELILCNTSLQHSLETSNKMVKHYEGIITSLKKKLQIYCRKNLKSKIEDLSVCVKKLFDIHSDMLSMLPDDAEIEGNDVDMEDINPPLLQEDSDVQQHFGTASSPVTNGISTLNKIIVDDQQPSTSGVNLRNKKPSKPPKRKHSPVHAKGKQKKKARLRVRVPTGKRASVSPSEKKFLLDRVKLEADEPFVLTTSLVSDTQVNVNSLKEPEKKKNQAGEPENKKNEFKELRKNYARELEAKKKCRSTRRHSLKNSEEPELVFISDDDDQTKKSTHNTEKNSTRNSTVMLSACRFSVNEPFPFKQPKVVVQDILKEKEALKHFLTVAKGGTSDCLPTMEEENGSVPLKENAILENGSATLSEIDNIEVAILEEDIYAPEQPAEEIVSVHLMEDDTLSNHENQYKEDAPTKEGTFYESLERVIQIPPSPEI